MKLKIENSEYEIFSVTESIRTQTDFKEFVVSVHVKNDLISIDELDAKVASEFTGSLEIINEEGSVSYTGYEYNYITREIYPERSILRLDFRKKI